MKMPKNLIIILKYTICIISAGTILWMDSKLELGGGVPYVVLVLLGLWFSNNKAPIYMGILGTILTIIGYYLSPEIDDEWKILLNRGYSLFVIWMTSVGVFWQKLTMNKLEKYSKSLKDSNKDLEDKVRERTQELTDSLRQEKEVNEMKSRFVSIASHEFRTPLSTVLSSISLIENYNKNGQYEKQIKHISRIKQSVKNLTNILNDFLSLDRLEQNKVLRNNELFELNDFLQTIIDDFDGILKQNQKIIYNHNGSGEVFLDKKLVRHVLMNLLSNAIKYSDHEITVISEIDTENVKIDIIDKGIGIPQEEQKQLFAMFFRANNTTSYQGTGLGLNIVKRYVELLNGTVTFTSKPNKGSTFTVTIPNQNFQITV